MPQTADGPVPLWAIVNSCARMTTVGAFKVAMTPCTLIYRFVHGRSRPAKRPETLGPEGPKAAGFSAQPGLCRRRMQQPVQAHGIDVRRCVRIMQESLPWSKAAVRVLQDQDCRGG